MAKKPNPSDHPIKDSLTLYTSIIGALVFLPVLVPAVPWRKMAADGNLGGRFTMARFVHPFSITNNLQKGVSWMKMRRDMCAEVQKMSQPNPVGMVLSTVADKVPGAGGTLPGCALWKACKDHALARCSAYTNMAIVGICTLLLVFLGLLCAICTCVCLSMEAGAGKKKKKQEEVKFNTMICSVLALAFNAVGCLAWIFTSQMTFDSLQDTGYYPYPGANVGMYMTYVGMACLSIATVCGIWRTIKPDQAKATVDNEEYADMGLGELPPDMIMMGEGIPPNMMGDMPPDMMGMGGMPPPPMMGMGGMPPLPPMQ